MPGQPTVAAPDQNARLNGAMRSDDSGRYRFETIKPKGDGGAPALVHYVLNAPGYKARMFGPRTYFAGDRSTGSIL